MVSVEKALEVVLAHTPTLPGEEALLPDALGRVLVEDVSADVDMPPFDRAAMDGYALRADDVIETPVTLDVMGSVRAGQYPKDALAAGQAVQIMTGAPVPRGATAVQPVEKTRPVDDGRRVEIQAPVEAGANIAPQGSEARAGDLVLRRGEILDPAAMAV